MQIDRLLGLIEQLLPAQTAMENDRIGLQVHSGPDEVHKLLVTLEINDEVIDEAVLLDCDCIITFHPLIFNPLTSLVQGDRVGRLCSKLIGSGIALISVHTNFDAFAGGTSRIFADKLGFETIGFLAADDNFVDKGMGVVAVPASPMMPEELLEKVSSICCSPPRYSATRGSKINKIAIVGGSGRAFMENAIEAGADAFITADLTYHTFHAAAGKIMLIDPGHYEMEQFVPAGLKRLIEGEIRNEQTGFIRLSKVLTNPVAYYPDSKGYSELQGKYLMINNN